MYLLAKLAALGIAIWFYMSADEAGEPPIKWAIMGLVGYVITWFLVDFGIDSAFSSAAARHGGTPFVAGQIPAFAGLLAAYFIRKKLINISKATPGDKPKN